MATDNRTLGRFHLVGIPPAPRGMPQIEVTFDIDANGIVNVSAKDLGTGKEQKITISGSSGLNEEEIDRMVKDAETHSGEDRDRRKKVEARNQLDGLVYSTEKAYEENKEKLSAEDKGTLESALSDAKSALESEDAATMEQAAQKLQEASHTLAQHMYEQPPGGAEGAPGQAPGAETSQDDEVIDAEFVDVDEAAN